MDSPYLNFLPPGQSAKVKLVLGGEDKFVARFGAITNRWHSIDSTSNKVLLLNLSDARSITSGLHTKPYYAAGLVCHYAKHDHDRAPFDFIFVGNA